jgi:3'-5' exoribonuclease
VHDTPAVSRDQTAGRFPFATRPELGCVESGVAVLVDREEKVTRQGRPYVRLGFRNRTGAVTVNVWENQLDVIAGIGVGSPVHITLTGGAGRDGALEWHFTDIHALPPNHTVSREAMPQCPVTRADLTARTMRVLNALSDEARDLFNRIMRTPVRGVNGVLAPVNAAFAEAPAALGHHHAHINGLWWHSLQVAEGAEAVALAYRTSGDAPDLDMDAVRLGGMVHDLGKILEYGWAGVIAMAPLSGSMSHMGHGLRLVTEALTRAEMVDGWMPTARQRQLAEHVQHIIASHHMQQRWGAISEPASREAWCVQSADMLSSRIQPLTDAIASITDRGDGLVQVQDGWKKKFVFAAPQLPVDAGAVNGEPAADDASLLTLTLDTLTTEA